MNIMKDVTIMRETNTVMGTTKEAMIPIKSKRRQPQSEEVLL